MSDDFGRDLRLHQAPPDLLARAMARADRAPVRRSPRTGLALAAALALGLVGGWMARGATPAPVTGQAPTVVLANADAPVSVRLVLHAPGATTVAVAGTFNGWDPAAQPLERAEDGTWHTVVSLPRGRYEYLFVVDGTTWVGDPTAPLTTPDDFGQANAILDV